MIPGCETSGRSGTEVQFSYIRTNLWGSLAGVSDDVGSCGGCWILGQSYTTYSAVSSQIPTDGVY